MVYDGIKTPVRDLANCSWDTSPQKTKLYSTGSSKSIFSRQVRPEELLVFCVLLIIFGSAIFSIVVLTNALNGMRYAKRDQANGPEHAFREKLVIVDEFGVPLGI